MRCSTPPIDPQEWEVVYDVCSGGLFIPRLIIYPGLVLPAAILVGLVYLTCRNQRHRKALQSAAVVALLSGMTCVFIMLEVAASWLGLMQAIDDQAYSVHEGIVTDFSPADAFDRGAETFRIGGRRYGIRAAELTAAYSQTAVHGGLLHEGLRVQIIDVNGEIARLGIARSR